MTRKRIRRRRRKHFSVDGYDMVTPEGRQGFVFDLWPVLATYGWEEYMRNGRGALVVECTREGPEPPKYVTSGGFGGAEFNAEVEGAIREYDPHGEIVMIFTLQGLGFALERYGVDSSAATPPMCDARLRNTVVN